MTCDIGSPCGGAVRDETISAVRMVRCIGGGHTLLVEREPDTRTATLTALIEAEAHACDVCGAPVIGATERRKRRHAKCRRIAA